MPRSSEHDPYFDANLARWDESVAIHAASLGYDLEGYLRVENTLYETEMDEVALAPATMGTPIPADRGSHVIVVSAPGHHTFKGEVSVVDGKATTIEVPELPPLPPTPPSGDSATATKPAATTDAYGPPPGRAQRTWGYVSLGVGALGIAAGSILGVSAMQRKDESLTECDPVQTNRCNSIGSAIRADARTLGTASTIGFIAGGVLVATGVTLLLTAPKGTQVGFSAGPGLARLSFRTTF